MSPETGVVYLVGAGPGDPKLLTLRGAELLARADAVVYDGLVSRELLALAGAGAELVYAGKKHAPGGTPRTQDEINALLVELGSAGKRVVRLKGGDPFVFGRGAEECRVLAAAGIRFEIVPGVTAATAVPGYAGIPLTAREVASTVAFATGHEAAGKPQSSVDWEALARAGTVVLFMALQSADECCRELVAAGRAASTPAAAIYWGTTASQRTVVGTLADLPATLTAEGLRPPVLLVVGDVVRERETLAWYERRPLFGARVVLTRGGERGRAYAGELAELGAEILAAPTTRLGPAADPGPLAAAVASLDTYDWVLFASANAADHVFAALAAAGRDARALGSCKVAAIGAATAAALAARGIVADVVPPHAYAEDLAEAVATVADPAGARILLPRAEGGREAAARALRAAGATVDEVIAYRSEPVPQGDPALSRALARIDVGEVQGLVCFAPSQVRALAVALGERAAKLLAPITVVAIGTTTAAALADLGVRVDGVAPAPEPRALAAELAACFRRRAAGHQAPPR